MLFIIESNLKRKLIICLIIVLFNFESGNTADIEKSKTAVPKDLQSILKYPEFAKKYGIGGTVVVRALIDQNGRVERTLIEKSHSSFRVFSTISPVSKQRS